MAEQLWLDKKWKPSWSFRAFVRKHDRWLTIVGAATVFTTFILKDAYRESLKEVVAAISQAESTYAAANTAESLMSGIDQLSKQVVELQDTVTKKKPTKIDTEFAGY